MIFRANIRTPLNEGKGASHSKSAALFKWRAKIELTDISGSFPVKSGKELIFSVNLLENR